MHARRGGYSVPAQGPQAAQVRGLRGTGAGAPKRTEPWGPSPGKSRGEAGGSANGAGQAIAQLDVNWGVDYEPFKVRGDQCCNEPFFKFSPAAKPRSRSLVLQPDSIREM